MNAVPPTPTFPWTRAVLAVVLIELAMLGLYAETVRTMVETWWRSQTFNHAFLVPPIALWLIWEKRAHLAVVPPQPSLAFLLPTVALGFVWLLGDLAAVKVVTQFALVGLMIAIVPLVIGREAARRITFPLAFLLFAVPFGEFLLPKLMEWTAFFTVLGLRASGIPVYQEGLHFVIPSGRWSVVEACSGVRYLIASLVVGTLYAYLNYQSLKRRLIFVALSIVVPLLANWLRAYGIVMLGHLTNNTLAVGVDHLIYGWLFFGVVILILFAIGLRWREAPAAVAPAPVALAAKPAVGLARLAGVTGLALALVAAPRLALVALDAAGSVPPPRLEAAWLARGGWQLEATAPYADWQPDYQAPTAALYATLVKAERRIGVSVVWYQDQDYERKLISSVNALVKSGNPHWALVGRGERQTSLAGREWPFREAQLRRLDGGLTAEALRLTVWQSYWIDGRFVSSDHVGKLRLALMRLAGRGDAAAAVSFHAAEPGAASVLNEYLADAGAGVIALLEHAVQPAPTVPNAYTDKQ